MPLQPGTRLGPYEITAPLGAGGMGEVYRARDTKLKRDVALKVLPDLMASDPDRLARFHREAEVLAALSHPNIAAIYGFEDANATHALVMELIEGEDLSQRIARGAIPLDQAVPIAKQIAEGLEAAHERGITHRDLKPANIKVRPDGTVKVLDFGLAKVMEPAALASGASQLLATIAPAVTETGMILGTPAYMSPEQVRGEPVSKLADIWAFGVVLYEMLSGARLYQRATAQETISSVLRDEPDYGTVPTEAHRLLKRCLEKDPQQRLRHIGDVMSLLDEAPARVPLSTTAPPLALVTENRLWLAVAAAIVVIAGATLLMWAPWRSEAGSGQAVAGQAVRFEVGPADKMTFTAGGAMAVSPDGRWLVFPAVGEDGLTRYWIRSLDTVEVRALPGTESRTNAGAPASWSWDSRSVIFTLNNKLNTADIQGGPSQTLADVPGSQLGIASNRDGVIVFGTNRGGPLLRASASGGVAPTPVTALDKSESVHIWPQFLPDGRHFLYLRVSSDPNKMGVYIGAIDAKPEQQSLTRLLATDRQAYYAASPAGGPGHLVFLRERRLMAQPFDPVTMVLSGEPAAIVEGVDSYSGAYYGLFSVSDTGTLAYRRASLMVPTWFDPQGHPGGTLGEPGDYANPTVSPDGTRVAVGLGPAASRNIWILDVARGTPTRFTFDAAADDYPVWSPDGKNIVFSSSRSGPGDLYIKPADGSADERLLFKSDERKAPTSWSHDGRYLLFTSIGRTTAEDLWALSMQGEGKAIPILRTQFRELLGQFSPDGRWIAYMSSESGPGDIWVRPFSPEAAAGTSGAKWMVSEGPAFYSRWQADGKALFYTSFGLQQMAVEIDTSKGFQAGAPRRLFVTPPVFNVGWDLAPDGKRFLLVAPLIGARPIPFTVVVNWPAGLKK